MTKKQETVLQKNSLSLLTPEQRLKNAQKSNETKRRRKEKRETMALIYGGFLKDKFEIEIDGKNKKITGAQYCDMIIRKILQRGDNVTVALLKEMREAMQGDTHNIEININKAIASSPEDRAREYKKLMGYSDEEIEDAEYEVQDEPE